MEVRSWKMEVGRWKSEPYIFNLHILWNSIITQKLKNSITQNMGISKTEQFTEEQNEVAKLMKALSHPARIAIVEYLLSVDACICNDIVEEVKLAQPTVSQHLKELKNAEIIQGEIDGKAICYCINPETLKKMEHFISEIFRKIENQKSCC